MKQRNEVLQSATKELQERNLDLLQKLDASAKEIKTLREENESRRNLDTIFSCQKEKYQNEIAKLKEQVEEKNNQLRRLEDEYEKLYNRQRVDPRLAQKESLLSEPLPPATTERGRVVTFGGQKSGTRRVSPPN